MRNHSSPSDIEPRILLAVLGGVALAVLSLVALAAYRFTSHVLNPIPKTERNQ